MLFKFCFTDTMHTPVLNLFMPTNFDIFRDEPIGEGGESIVYLTQAKDYVVKIPNTKSVREGDPTPRPQELLDFIASPEHGRDIEADYPKVKEIFGDRLLDTWYFPMLHPLTGKMSYATVQRNMDSLGIKGLDKLSETDRKTVLNDPRNREDLIDLFWQIKKYCHTFNIPYDIYINFMGNIGYKATAEDVEPKFYILEAGFPTSARSMLLKKPEETPFPLLLYEKFKKRITEEYIPELREMEKSIAATPEERNRLNQKYFGDSDFDFEQYLIGLGREYQK